MKTACIILNYKGADSALRLYEQIQKLPFKSKYVFIVENGSPDDSLSKFQEFAGKGSIIHTPVNLGYAGGMNLGLKHALENTDADFFWILTKDLTVEQDSLEILHSLWPKLNNPGFLGSLTDLNATEKIYFFKATINPNGSTKHGTKGRSLDQIPELHQEYGITDYVNGSCVFTSRQVLNDVGLIPEEYFLYFEDCEWGLRALRKGYRNYVSYRSRVHHHRDIGGFNKTAEYYCRRNAYIFKKRNGFLKPWTKFFDLLKVKKHILKAKLKKNPQLLEVLQAVHHDIHIEKSGLGPWR